MTVPSTLTLLLLLTCTGWSQTNSTSERLIRVAGTRVSLVPPVGFVTSPQFPGFVQESTGASILVAEFPSSIGKMSIELSKPSKLRSEGMVLIGHQPVGVGARQRGHLCLVSQRAHSIEYLKWILLLGDETEVAMVTASFPKQSETTLSSKLKASLLTAERNRAKAVHMTEGLSFRVDAGGELKLTKRLVNMLLFTQSGSIPRKSDDEPFFIAGSSFSQLNIKDSRTFSQARVLSTTSVVGIRIQETKEVAIDNLGGFEIIAKGRDQKSGLPMLIYQTILFDGQVYYLMQGLVSVRNGDDHLTTFKKMARSFRRK